MIEEPARVRLELQSRPENVALVRAALSGFAEAAGLDDEFLADLKTAVSEACNNSVIHAYTDTVGPIVVDIEALHDGLSVSVLDHGRGIVRLSSGEDRMGLGLAVISALADRAEFRTPEGGGTEVRMWFSHNLGFAPGGAAEPWPDEHRDQLEGDIVAWFSPAEIVRFVLGRVFRAVAASSRFSVERFSDLYAVNDAIADYAEVAADGGLSMSISGSSRRLDLTGGPFRFRGELGESETGSDSQQELEARKRALAGVVDTLSTERLGGQELLHLVLVDSSREPL